MSDTTVKRVTVMQVDDHLLPRVGQPMLIDHGQVLPGLQEASGGAAYPEYGTFRPGVDRVSSAGGMNVAA